MPGVRLILLNEKIRKQIVRATAKFPEKGGRGSLLNGNLIHTAMHVLGYTTNDLEFL